MSKLSKTSTTYRLSEYLEDLSRAGVRDFYRGDPSAARVSPTLATTVSRPVAASSASSSNPAKSPANSTPTSQPTPPTPPTRPLQPNRPIQLAQPIESFESKQERAFETARPFDAIRPLETSPDADERSARLRVVAEEVSRCSKCAELVANRTQTVFGSGIPCAELVFVGEGPGADEDEQGLPFVGRSGKLLTDMIEKGMGIPRASVFICNVVRCRPPQNRNPNPDEALACRPFLDATLEIIRPKFICCLGAIAARHLLGVDVAIGKLRGKVCDYRGAKVVCTYHPAYLLRNPPAKKQTWDDLQLLMREMGLSVPKK